MAITPADIEQLTFSPSKHGYDTEEVDNFLEQLTGELDAMLKNPMSAFAWSVVSRS